MTVYRCVGCGSKIEKDSPGTRVCPEEIKGICPECYARNPDRAKKVPEKTPKFIDSNRWMRY